MFKVVFDGGPHAGKTTVSKRLQAKYPSLIFVTPEVASCLTEKLIPLPGRDLDLSQDWLFHFQTTVTPTQIAMEKMWQSALEQRNTKTKLMIIDRGILSGAAYFPDGLDGFLNHFDLDLEESLARYDMIIHFETLAKSQPELFGKTDNEQRYENHPQEAVERDDKIKNIWANHPNWKFMPSSIGIENIFDNVEKLIQPYLS